VTVLAQLRLGWRGSLQPGQVPDVAGAKTPAKRFGSSRGSVAMTVGEETKELGAGDVQHGQVRDVAIAHDGETISVGFRNRIGRQASHVDAELAQTSSRIRVVRLRARS
jgi:hypothetical protein